MEAYDDIDPNFKAIVIIPKVGGVLSMVGSLLILRDVTLKIKLHRTIPLSTKIMTLITVALLFIGFWDSFLSTWMVPKDSPHAFLASGNVTTCNIQAFFAVSMLIIVETAYTMLSALYYITVARRDWTTAKTQSSKVMLSFLALPIVIGLGFAIPLLVTNQFNFTGVYSCSISPYPLGCEYEEDIPCTRGPNSSYILRGLFIYVLFCFAFIVIFLSLLLYNLKKHDSQTAKYASHYLGGKGGGVRIPVAVQALRYVTVFFIPNIAFIIWAIIDIFHIQISTHVWLAVLYLYVIVWPMFGALNALVYFRLRFLNERRSNPDAAWTILIGKTFTISPLSNRTSTPPQISALIDEDDNLSSPLFEDESATGSNDVALSAETATGHCVV
ncbi:hypothetical protein ACHAXM_011545 [Skeletonema potamos]